MATQPYILSFDEAKRDTRARRPSSAAPESRPVIHSVDAIPAFESPFRQAGEGRGSARTAAHARPSGAARRSSAGAGDGSFARISTFDRPAGRHAARASGVVELAPCIELVRHGPASPRSTSASRNSPEEEVEERRLTRKEQRKKARAKSKAERAFHQAVRRLEAVRCLAIGPARRGVQGRDGREAPSGRAHAERGEPAGFGEARLLAGIARIAQVVAEVHRERGRRRLPRGSRAPSCTRRRSSATMPLRERDQLAAESWIGAGGAPTAPSKATSRRCRPTPASRIAPTSSSDG